MGLLGTTIETPHELYVHKLGAALTMERTILDMLPQLRPRLPHPRRPRRATAEHPHPQGADQRVHDPGGRERAVAGQP